MLLLLTVSVENLSGYDTIICEFALSTFNLHDQPRKRERAEKQWALENICIYLFTLCSGWKPRYVNAVKMSLSIYSIHPSFPTFNIKMIKFVPCRLLQQLLWISRKCEWRRSAWIFVKLVLKGLTCASWL